MKERTAPLADGFISESQFKIFKKAYEASLKNRNNVFFVKEVFGTQPVVKAYAKYVIEYLTEQFK